MNGQKCVDISAIMQVIGNVYNNLSILDNEKYHFNEEDFPNEFHRILFGSIYNLHLLGAESVTSANIEDYLEGKPKKMAIYESNKGTEYLQQISEISQIAAFDYYYQRMKKMSLLRAYYNAGLDISYIYDPDNILDIRKKQQQEEWLDNTSIERIADTIDQKIVDIRLKYIDEAEEKATPAGQGLLELLNRYKEEPEIGVPLYGDLINTIVRGARLKKVYMRSAPTGIGKTKSMIADMCYIACDEIYDSKSTQWIKNGTKEPAIFISTEQEKEEIQTMMLAFISDVNEEHILRGKYYEGEWERVVHAAEIIASCNLCIQELPDFSMKDIENTIKRGIRDFNVRYVAFDYIHSSMKILSEVSSNSGIRGLREDNILFLIGVKIKDIANQYGVFIETATQVNGDWKYDKIPDQNLLRGSKALGDKIDVGEILLNVTEEDLEYLKPYIEKGFSKPDKKISIYKVRRGQYNRLYLWCMSNLGTCKINPIFATTYDYQPIQIDDLRIEVEDIHKF